MIALLEEMIARLFGKRQEQLIRVRADQKKPLDRLLKGPK